MRTVIAGQLVELPGTIAAIRAALDESRAEEFDAEIPHVPVAELPLALARWALATTDADAEDAALFERLARGEDTRG
ncbi:hypothetical protein I3F58_09565 [Streptomyces sp. MUM 203J]|uniref:hypothetical protein n=1 Tax=Streptomyces sp. MUM 203J TaxID=2791990 RepID=UPI001F043ACF|nr:hypothetical protein [Streptomyces sp. MUM 203J]MCH0539807.1 hypothetical protein [Streptomyces sp. MUM 203J]